MGAMLYLAETGGVILEDAYVALWKISCIVEVYACLHICSVCMFANKSNITKLPCLQCSLNERVVALPLEILITCGSGVCNVYVDTEIGS